MADTINAASDDYAPPPEPPDHELPKMSFLEHLDELRRRLVYSLIALAVGFLVCWAFAPRIFELIQRPLSQYLPKGDTLAYTRLTAPFFLYMKVAFFAGIFLAAPFIIRASLFFLIGGYFGYAYILPGTCKFFVETGKQFKQMITIDDYFSFASTIVLATGAVFETPILIFFLARLGIVTPAFLMQKFKYADVLSFIIAAIVTPTPDMVTQTFLAVPMI